MIFIDTSAWVEFLRNTGSPVCFLVDDLLDNEIATCDAVRMEVLAGARDETHLLDLRRLLARAAILPTLPIHYENASRLYRQCRRRGETVHKLMDCLIAAVAIDAQVPVVYEDSDFDALVRNTELQAYGALTGG